MVARGGFASEPHCSLATIAGAELLQKLNLRPAGCCVWTRVLIRENAVPHTVAKRNRFSLRFVERAFRISS